MTPQTTRASPPTGDSRQLPEVSVAPTPSATARTLAIVAGEEMQLATGLAAALTLQEKKVCLLDARQGPEATDADAEFLLAGQDIDSFSFLQRDPTGLWHAPPVRNLGTFQQLDPGQQKHLLSTLRYLERRFDYLLIDTGNEVTPWLTELRLAAPHSIFSITPNSRFIERAFSLLAGLRTLGFKHTVYLIIDQVSGLLVGHYTYNRFQQRAASLDIDLRCAGFLLSGGHRAASPPPGAAGNHYLDSAVSRLGQLLDRTGGGDADIGRFFERQLPDQRQPEKPTGEADPEKAGLLAASYHAALLARLSHQADRATEKQCDKRTS